MGRKVSTEPDRFPNRNRKPRKPRARALAKAAEFLLTNPTAALIDKHTGLPDGERIIAALAVLAVGNHAEIAAFFGEPMRLRARDRRAALVVLEQRRFGKVQDAGGAGPQTQPPPTIVNVFTSAAEYAFVTQARPSKAIGPTRPLLEEAHERE